MPRISTYGRIASPLTTRVPPFSKEQIRGQSNTATRADLTVYIFKTGDCGTTA